MEKKKKDELVEVLRLLLMEMFGDEINSLSSMLGPDGDTADKRFFLQTPKTPFISGEMKSTITRSLEDCVLSNGRKDLAQDLIAIKGCQTPEDFDQFFDTCSDECIDVAAAAVLIDIHTAIGGFINE